MLGRHVPAAVVVEATAPLAVVVVAAGPAGPLLTVSFFTSGSVFVIWIILKQEARIKTNNALPNEQFFHKAGLRGVKIVKYLGWKGGCLKCLSCGVEANETGLCINSTSAWRGPGNGYTVAG